jgi:hypothetical protein
MNLRRFFCVLTAVGLLLFSVGLTACGKEENSKDTSEGVPVVLGEMQYKVLFSRFLNPNDVEDAEYLVGQAAPGPDQNYLGVFVQIINKDKDADGTIPSGWVVEDTQGNSFDPLPSESPYALVFDASVGPEDQVPALDSTAQVGPIGGSMILFSIPDSATANRPLELTISTQDGSARVKLDA